MQHAFSANQPHRGKRQRLHIQCICKQSSNRDINYIQITNVACINPYYIPAVRNLNTYSKRIS